MDVAGSARLRDRPWLLVMAMLPPVAELITLWAIGLAADRALAVQASAPTTLGEYHDLRWLMVLSTSWWSLAWEAAALLALRSLFNAVIIHQAWPVGERPSFLTLWRRSALASLAIEVFIAPWAVLSFGVAVVSISWLWIAAVPPIVIVALASGHGPARRGWWHQLPPRRSVGWILLTVLGTTVIGALLAAAPAALWLPLALGGGLFDAWAWRGLVGAAAGRSATDWRRFVPASPGVAIGMLVVAVGGTALAFHLVSPSRATAAPAATTQRHGPPVIVVSGFDTVLAPGQGEAFDGPFDEVRYSYTGLTATGAPRPYTAADTHQSLALSVRRLAEQVDAIHRRTGRRVGVVAQSEGSLIALIYVDTHPRAPVSRLVLLSPLDRPGAVYYPPAGRRGYGAAAGVALDGLTDLLARISPIDLPADSPFLRSIVDHAGGLRDLLACPTGSVPTELIEPVADSVVDPSDPAPRTPTVVVPSFHGGLLSDPTAETDIDDFLEGRTPARPTGMGVLSSVLRLAGAPWGVPDLPLSLYPSGGSDAPSCGSMVHALRAWVDPAAP